MVAARLAPIVGCFVGRESEIALLRRALEARATQTAPLVWLVHGIAGTGKTSLLCEWVKEAKRASASIVQVNARHLPPSPEAFQEAFARAQARIRQVWQLSPVAVPTA